jgi:hypothetical protein
MQKIIKILLVFAAIFATQAHAAFTPLAIDIAPPIQFPPSDFSITGVRLSALWGNHRNVYGLDLGLLGNVTQLENTSVAVSGLFNITGGTTNAMGLQVAGLFNYNAMKTRVIGIQAAAIVNINSGESTVGGLEIALVNLAEHTKIYGLQAGLFNKAQDVYGFQIGVINMTNALHGIQIGLLNFNYTGTFSVSPFLNVGF